MVASPPPGVEYFPKSKAQGRQEYTLCGPFSSAIRSVVDGGFKTLNIPRCAPIVRQYDLVHSWRGFLILGRNKYVVDFEHVSSFAGMDHLRMQSVLLRKRIERALRSDRCTRLLPHSKAALDSISLLPSGRELANKSTVVYPTVDTKGIPANRHEEKGPPRILFYGEYYWKGGREVLQACKRLASKLDFVLTYISLRVHPPEGVVTDARKKFHLRYHEGPIPRKTLFKEVYPATDLFVMPSYFDTLGYAFLEAMAHGIPCIGARHFATPETIEDGVNGILIDPPVRYFDAETRGHPEIKVEEVDTERTVVDLAEALEKLISSNSTRRAMGAASRRLLEIGNLSISKRNATLKEVYEESLRR